ncbi:P-loop containing nucleoside triphosphate hydrolase protein [Mycena olivaceomarginata]|nr:P-loop containing nucleoside triphosphate hydrolase protein [Mycena olivaceomarginata]
MTWASEHVAPMLETRVRLHFEEYILRAKLRLDLPTGADLNKESSVTAMQAWHAFIYLSEIFQRTLQLSSQILFIFQQTNGGLIFTLLSLVNPVLVTKGSRYLWLQAFVFYSDNVNYLRLRALSLLASDDYREDEGQREIGEYFHFRAFFCVHVASNSDHEHSHTPKRGFAHAVFGRQMRFSTPRTTVTSFAILQQHSQALNFTCQMIYFNFTEAVTSFSQVKELYELASVENKIPDGDQAYPNFAHSIGANGSGKSTIIKLLNRLYDVDSGEIIVDGLPIKDYRIADLRKVQALLTQDHKLYPLTLAENIGLGHPDHVDNIDMILQAAESGGADGVIKRQNDGVNTVLHPVQTARGGHLDKYNHKKLKSILDRLEKKAELSGGEKQRIVAWVFAPMFREITSNFNFSSRTFMRFLSGNIRFAVADEPSSALDPKGEHQLFQRLRESGGGKTMIFVTHRFGHLTKHADLIICMKEGEAIETGTHKELMARGGEYSELYNVQAQAILLHHQIERDATWTASEMWAIMWHSRALVRNLLVSGPVRTATTPVVSIRTPDAGGAGLFPALLHMSSSKKIALVLTLQQWIRTSLRIRIYRLTVDPEFRQPATSRNPERSPHDHRLPAKV